MQTLNNSVVNIENKKKRNSYLIVDLHIYTTYIFYINCPGNASSGRDGVVRVSKT